MSELTLVRPGQSVGEAVKESIQTSAQDKAQAAQMIQIKKEISAKLNGNINSLMQSWSLGPDHAFSIALDYAIGMAQGTGTSKEAVLEGFEKLWASRLAQAEEVADEQRKMLLNVARKLMAESKPIPTPFLGQMQALGMKVPDDLQKYIDEQPKDAAADVKN